MTLRNAHGHAPKQFLALLGGAILLGTALAGCTGGLLGYDDGVQGTWAKEFLSKSEYTSLLVEIDHEPNAAPESLTLSSLRSNLEAILDKPGGVEIRTAVDVSSGGGKVSFSKIRDLEDGARDHFKANKQAVLYVMFLSAGSSEDTNNGRVLGASYSGSSIVMFKENIKQARANCQAQSPLGVGCPSVATLEEAVMIHELGHILGLVNNGIPMQTAREDAQHEGHSTNQKSVMYWAVDSGNIINFFLDGNDIPNKFDSNDRNDMRAAGGK